jgi:hypothetical protein
MRKWMAQERKTEKRKNKDNAELVESAQRKSRFLAALGMTLYRYRQAGQQEESGDHREYGADD